MEFFDAVLKRRSVRHFKIDAVADDLVKKVLDSGRWAPSAGNSQPWRFIVVTDPGVKQRIAEVCTEFSKKAWKQFPPERARYLAERGGSWDKSPMAKVPVLLVVCYETFEGIREELMLASAWLAVENMLLMATAKGLGSCVYTTNDNEEEARLKEILRMPPKHRIATIIQLGYTDGLVATPHRKKLEEITSYQHY